VGQAFSRSVRIVAACRNVSPAPNVCDEGETFFRNSDADLEHYRTCFPAGAKLHQRRRDQEGASPGRLFAGRRALRGRLDQGGPEETFRALASATPAGEGLWPRVSRG